MEWKTQTAPVDRQMEHRTLAGGTLPSALTPGLAWPGSRPSSSSSPTSCISLLPDPGCCCLFYPSRPCLCSRSPPPTPHKCWLFICLCKLFLFPPFLSFPLYGLPPSDLILLSGAPSLSLSDLLFSAVSLSLSLSVSAHQLSHSSIVWLLLSLCAPLSLRHTLLPPPVPLHELPLQPSTCSPQG